MLHMSVFYCLYVYMYVLLHNILIVVCVFTSRRYHAQSRGMILTTSNMIVGRQNPTLLMQALFLARVRKIIQIKQVIVIHIGLGLTWITPPNITVFLGEPFNVSYKATTSARFYDNMADSEYFSNST